MKVLSVTLIALVFFAVIFWGLFYYSVRIARETVTLPQPQATSTAKLPTTGLPSKTNLPPTPSANFHGPPSGNLPHVIGPSAPPPGY